MSTLDERTRVLADLVRSKNVGGVSQARPQAEAALTAAIGAASAFAATGSKPTAAMQSKWEAGLMAVQAALNESAALLKKDSVSVVVDGGFTIPGTSIVVPWAALIGVLAVAAAGWYFSRRRR